MGYDVTRPAGVTVTSAWCHEVSSSMTPT